MIYSKDRVVYEIVYSKLHTYTKGINQTQQANIRPIKGLRKNVQRPTPTEVENYKTAIPVTNGNIYVSIV